jgi:hypothetical protein
MQLAGLSQVKTAHTLKLYLFKISVADPWKL